MDAAKEASLREEMMESGFGGKTVGTDTSVTDSVQEAMSKLALSDKVAEVAVYHEEAGIEFRPSFVNDGDLHQEHATSCTLQKLYLCNIDLAGRFGKGQPSWQNLNTKGTALYKLAKQ